MNENKNRLTETVNRNFEEGGEIAVKIDYEESPRAEQRQAGTG